MGDLAGGRGEHRGGAGIEGIAAGPEQAQPGIDGELAAGGDEAMRAVEFGAQGAALFGTTARGGRRGLRRCAIGKHGAGGGGHGNPVEVTS